ncbi:MAG: anthranilate synthase component I [Actinobacteria bacterium]|nr:anthranilate synthase component I [Actinomycetota bacterium]
MSDTPGKTFGPADPAAAKPTLLPALERVRELAASGKTVIPLTYSFVEDCETPVSAYLKLRGSGPSFLLESAEQGMRFGRWSFIGVKPRSLIVLNDGKLMVDGDAAAFEDPYRAVAAHLERYVPAELPELDLPPFVGGAVGLFGYDLVRYVEPLGESNPDPIGIPDMALTITGALVAFDHTKHRVIVISNIFLDGDGDGDGDVVADVDAAYAEAASRIDEIRAALAKAVPHRSHEPREPEPFISNMGDDGYAAGVETIKEYVRAGDAYQVVPAQRWSGPCPVDPFSIYRGIRAINPSPYMYFLEFEDFHLAGGSPEPLVKVTGRHAEYRPIAGTRPRAEDPAGDAALAAELLADEKERAEHMMLVDLGRNDLGRVCEYGSVQVDDLMRIETFSHVLHIVSSISGKLREGESAIELLRSCLPSGTLSGAPKVRAMQIIDEVEPHKRGPYAGAVGYVDFGGNLDTCIVIRTVVVKDGQAYIQAGGGIVADSVAATEVAETHAKSRAVFRAMELAAAQPEWG